MMADVWTSTNIAKVTSENLLTSMLSKFSTCLRAGASVGIDLIFAPGDIALRKRAERFEKINAVADIKGDYPLDFISVWKTKTEFDWARQRNSIGQKGITVQVMNDDDDDVAFLEIPKAIPVKYEYEISYFTVDGGKLDLFDYDFMFWIQSTPKVTVNFVKEDGADLQYPLDFQVLFSPDMQQNSTVSDQYDEGKYWRKTYTIEVEAWLIENTEELHYAKTINLNIYDMDEEDIEYYTNVITEP